MRTGATATATARCVSYPSRARPGSSTNLASLVPPLLPPSLSPSHRLCMASFPTSTPHQSWRRWVAVGPSPSLCRPRLLLNHTPLVAASTAPSRLGPPAAHRQPMAAAAAVAALREALGVSWRPRFRGRKQALGAVLAAVRRLSLRAPTTRSCSWIQIGWSCSWEMGRGLGPARSTSNWQGLGGAMGAAMGALGRRRGGGAGWAARCGLGR